MIEIGSKKIKGSTLVEVLIALAITSFCTSLSVVIFLNIQKSSLSFFKLKAIEIGEQYMTETIAKNNFVSEEYQVEDFTVKKTISTHLQFVDCIVVRMIVFDASKTKIHEMESTVLAHQ